MPQCDTLTTFATRSRKVVSNSQRGLARAWTGHRGTRKRPHAKIINGGRDAFRNEAKKNSLQVAAQAREGEGPAPVELDQAVRQYRTVFVLFVFSKF